jgi:branched-chain amino acid transport system substrate-binding protein
MNSKIIGWLVVIVIVIWAGWSFSQKDESASGPIKIGVTVPLSGEAASSGESARAGALLAQKELNDAGGVDGRQIELVFEDDRCNTGGVSAMQKLVSVDNVDGIIGPVCSAVAGGAIPVARTVGKPVILIGASAPGLAGGADSIFSNYPSDAFQGKFVADYFYNTLGKRKVAVLYVNNDWGVGIRAAFVERFKAIGGEVVFDEGVPQDAKDMRTQAGKIKSAGADAVYMPLYPAGGIVAIKQLKSVGVTVPLFGGDSFLGDELVKAGVSEGIMYSAGKVGNDDAFKAKVKELTGIEPNIIAPLAYDAIKIYAKVIGEVGTESKKIVAALNSLSYTGGISFSTISYDDNGDLEVAPYEVFVFKNGKSELVK